MRLLERYIGSVVVQHIGVVLLILTAMYFFSTLASEVSNIGRGSYALADAFRFTLRLIPSQLYELFPMIALVGTMLGLGALAGSSELTVMRAAGVSLWQVVVATLKSGLLVLLGVVLVGELIAPPLEKQAWLERAQSLGKPLVAMSTSGGLWARDGRNFVNFRLMHDKTQVEGVTLYEFDDSRKLLRIIRAKKARYSEEGWLLQGVVQTRFGDEVTVQRSQNLLWPSLITPQVFDVVASPSESLSVFDLQRYIGYLQENGLESKKYELAYWVRMFTPLSMIGMVLLAVPFVFGSMRSVSVGQRILIGSLLGIGFYIVNAVFSRVAVVYEIWPMLSALIPTLVIFSLWVVLMRRVS